MRVSNSLDPDQVQLFVGPDLGPNYLQSLSADDIRMQRVKGAQILPLIFYRLWAVFKGVLTVLGQYLASKQ